MSLEIVIPCRNAPAVLALTLAHFFAGSHHGDVVTLIDNRSDAGGMDEVLRSAAERGCRVVRNEANVGVWASVNRGLALARSRWVMVLTSDVLLGPRTVEALSAVAESTGVPFLGPEVLTGIAQAHRLCARIPATGCLDLSRYNGACWLMDWERLRAEIGWFDTGYFIAYGDTDYIERMRTKGVPHAVTPGIPCVHIDKQTRRADWTAEEDTEVEVRDGARFHGKWRDNPEVLRRHPQVDRLGYLAMKAGWKEAIPA